jgi:uncharacterized protein YqeY
MSLAEDIKKRMFAAMKSGKVVEKEILRVATGEITMTGARESRDLSDEDVQGILRKLVKSVRESLATAPAEQKATLEEELTVIESLLPKSLDVDGTVAALASVHDNIRAAAGEGPAMGVAMKALKSQNLVVDAATVSAALKKIRG